MSCKSFYGLAKEHGWGLNITGWVRRGRKIIDLAKSSPLQFPQCCRAGNLVTFLQTRILWASEHRSQVKFKIQMHLFCLCFLESSQVYFLAERLSRIQDTGTDLSVQNVNPRGYFLKYSFLKRAFLLSVSLSPQSMSQSSTIPTTGRFITMSIPQRKKIYF